MDLHIPYFVYCERASWFFLEQPVNVLSNLAFFGAAAAVWIDDRGRGTSLSLLAGLLAICGLTGVAWHATELHSMLAFDVGAQLILSGVLATVLTHQILHWPPINSVMVGIVIVLLALFGRDLGLPYLLQNGGAFLPMMIFLVLLSFAEVQSGDHVPAKYLLAAAYVLFIGLILRSLDWPLCGTITIGMHWAWHLASALCAWLAIAAVHKNRIMHESPDANDPAAKT